jgi:hypothetical protein
MRQKNIVLFLCSLFVVLLITEIGLRVIGVQPGLMNGYDGFKKVDKLRLYNNFVTDEAGIYKFSPWVTDSLLKYFDCSTRKITNLEVKKALYDGDKVYYIYECFCKQTKTPKFSIYWSLLEYMNGGDAESNCLVETHHRILQNKVAADKVWEGAFMEYFSRPFNQDGFRSAPFKNYATKQLKVLVIGDSFVYGMDAHPQQNSFVDLLLSRGYLVYSAGIPGTDPAQYAAIAQKYIPIVKPDVVVSCFYTGNDYMSFCREPNEKEPLEHMTNAGLFSSNPYGQYLNAENAYRYYLSFSTFSDSTHGLFDKVCAASSIGTVLWNGLYAQNLIQRDANRHDLPSLNVPKDSVYTRTKVYTDRLAVICSANEVPLIQTVIPNLDVPQFDFAGLNFLYGNSYRMPSTLNLDEDYFKRGIHFNNNGSLKYANFLDSLLEPLAAEKRKANK